MSDSPWLKNVIDQVKRDGKTIMHPRLLTCQKNSKFFHWGEQHRQDGYSGNVFKGHETRKMARTYMSSETVPRREIKKSEIEPKTTPKTHKLKSSNPYKKKESIQKSKKTPLKHDTKSNNHEQFFQIFHIEYTTNSETTSTNFEKTKQKSHQVRKNKKPLNPKVKPITIVKKKNKFDEYQYEIKKIN